MSGHAVRVTDRGILLGFDGNQRGAIITDGNPWWYAEIRLADAIGIIRLDRIRPAGSAGVELLTDIESSLGLDG